MGCNEIRKRTQVSRNALSDLGIIRMSTRPSHRDYILERNAPHWAETVDALHVLTRTNLGDGTINTN